MFLLLQYFFVMLLLRQFLLFPSFSLLTVMFVILVPECMSILVSRSHRDPNRPFATMGHVI